VAQAINIAVQWKRALFQYSGIKEGTTEKVFYVLTVITTVTSTLWPVL